MSTPPRKKNRLTDLLMQAVEAYEDADSEDDAAFRSAAEHLRAMAGMFAKVETARLFRRLHERHRTAAKNVSGP